MLLTGLFSPQPGTSWIEPLPPDHLGTIRTLEVMRFLARRDCRSLFVSDFTSSILRSRESDPVPETLFYFARDGIRFVEDPPDIEQVSTFERTTRSGQGDCDDKCVWLATALLNQNIPCRFRVQSYDGAQWDHVFVEYYDWGLWQWRALDPTADGHSGITAEPGWRQPLPRPGKEMIYQI